jgi:hypothetical protein
MTTRQKNALRNAILLQLHAAYPASLPDDALCEGLKLAGFDCDERIAATELEYLNELGFLNRESSELSEGIMRSKLNAKGIGYLERNGF